MPLLTSQDAGALIDAHKAALQQRSRRTWNQYVSVARVREAAFAVVAVLATLGCVVSSMLALKYASTIVTVKDTRLVDSYGQLIGRDVRVARNPASAEPGLLLTNCIERAFANYRSYYAMHENHNDALQCVASGSAAEATLKSEWAKWSTLGPDDTFLPSRAEQSVVVTSVLDHGKYSQNEEDYAVQFKVTVHGDQDTGDTEQLWIGDFVIASNGTATDISPWGLYITRISVSKVKV